MNKKIDDNTIAIRIWFGTWVIFSLGVFVYFTIDDSVVFAVAAFFIAALVSCIGSVPAWIILCFRVGSIQKKKISIVNKLLRLAALLLFIVLLYGFLAAFLTSGFSSISGTSEYFFEPWLISAGVLAVCVLASCIVSHNKIMQYLSQDNGSEFIPHFPLPLMIENQINTYMELNYNSESETNYPSQKRNPMNKVLSKAIITGILILAMLIPTFFISGLVTEREDRQEKIVAESSSRWSNAQTLSGPYIFIPYKNISKHIIVLPKNADVNGQVTPEERDRSIYKILFYKSDIKSKGNFQIKLPKDIDSAALDFGEARICLGISDYKGIEEKVSITFNGIQYELSPGLPTTEIDTVGLSAPVQLSADDLSTDKAFNYDLKIKGAGQLHFLPLSGNSTFTLKSSWNNPSFDGNTLPNDNKITADGFTAKWIFNKANLPFPSILTDGGVIKKGSGFGVSILQPADHYAKTARCIKYAILFIGLTFSLFFIVEIMQKKSMHPVQYILVGLALVIFYTLLLSISEYLYFDYAYLIAAIATVSLISLYAKGHFKSWKIAGLFGLILGGLYGFNYVLISLEDTALLVGSISLFIVLAIVMYVSRKINWYNTSIDNVQPEIV